MSSHSLPLIETPLSTRFLTKIVTDPTTGCWHWLGAFRYLRYKDAEYRYGSFSETGQASGPMSAHRYSYKVHKGPIPEGHEIDHICQNKLCVNPEHLRAVTHRENCKRRPKSGPLPGYRLINGRKQ